MTLTPRWILAFATALIFCSLFFLQGGPNVASSTAPPTTAPAAALDRARKLRLTYEDLAPLNDRLIYASATGYGEQGDDVEEPSFDMTAYWARSGLMDAVHNADAEPTLSVAGMGDHPSSMALFCGIMLALYQRERTGRGTKVSTSLMANGVWANGCLIQAALCNAMPYDQSTRVAPINPLVNHYVTRDGKRFIFCLIQVDQDWPNLCRAIGHPELIADPRFATSMDCHYAGSDRSRVDDV